MEFTFKVSEANANLILEALSNLPFKVSNNLIQELLEQAKAQVTTQVVSTEEEPENNE